MNLVEQLADTIPPPAPPFPKSCGCGVVYLDASAWERLGAIGTMEDGAGGELELRNCAACASTLAIELVR